MSPMLPDRRPKRDALIRCGRSRYCTKMALAVAFLLSELVNAKDKLRLPDAVIR
jgi:hypothetical protein